MFDCILDIFSCYTNLTSMARVPFIGRLFWWVAPANNSAPYPEQLLTVDRREYLALFGSLILIFLEGFIRVITLGLRNFLQCICSEVLY